MISQMSTTKEKDVTLWEETGSTEPKKKSVNKLAYEETSSMPNTNSDYKKKECRDIGKISGIYKIINKVNGKYYLGSTQNCKVRWTYHRNKLNRNCHDNNHLQNSWNKYSDNNFVFVIVELCDIDDLLVLEQKYLDECKMNPRSNYNISYDAVASMRGRKFSPETIEKLRMHGYKQRHSVKTKHKISLSRIGNLNPFYKTGPIKAIQASALKRQKSIIQMDNLGNAIEKFSSILEASRKFGIPTSAISRVCSGEYTQTHGFLFRFENLH